MKHIGFKVLFFAVLLGLNTVSAHANDSGRSVDVLKIPTLVDHSGASDVEDRMKCLPEFWD